jgi:UDP-2,3-diacylglucosamine pyrophosphatase LpxH
MMREPVRIFSDLHLGHKASRIKKVESLRPLFAGVGTAIFNGDTWEELVPEWREKSAAMLHELRELLQTEGCEAIFLPGNHDPSWDGAGYLDFEKRKILITHGDALLRDGAPWKREMLAHQDVIEELWAQHPEARDHLHERLKLARAIAKALPTQHNRDGASLFSRALDAAFPTKRACMMLSAWWQQAKLGAKFCENYCPETEILICGHFHRYGIRQSRGIISVNTGSFVVPGSAGFVEWNERILSFHKIAEDGKTFFPKQGKLLRDFKKKDF